jgi:ATP-dependent DNA helicase RecG
MVIQHANRYGLSQLHQLRGRVGRGDRPGHCLLIADSAEAAMNARLSALVKETDGFRIAEEDLRLRGPGEMLGTRQHGLPELRVADLLTDVSLLHMAQRDAKTILENDPALASAEFRRLRESIWQRYGDRLELAATA